MSTIKIKRGLNANIGTLVLQQGELAMTTDNPKTVYVGVDGTTTKIKINDDLGLYAHLSSPTFTGTPTAPTASAGTNTTQIATTAFVASAIANLVGSAPSALDTLNELATALGNDANFSATITNALAGKAPLAGATFTGNVAFPTASAGTNTTQGATTAFVATAIANALSVIDGGTF